MQRPLRQYYFAFSLFIFSISFYPCGEAHAQSGQPVQAATTAGTPSGETLLSVGGEVEHSLKLSAADLSKLPRQTIRAKDHDGKESTFEGVELAEILKLAGVKFGEGLHGKALAQFLVVVARDGYRVVFALPELDHGFTDRVIILADRQDGKPLADNVGPLRIIAPDEKHPARWARQVNSLIIQRAQ